MQFSNDELKVIKEVFTKIFDIEDEDWWTNLDQKSFLSVGIFLEVQPIIDQMSKESE